MCFFIPVYLVGVLYLWQAFLFQRLCYVTLLIFSKLFTRRRLHREQEAARPWTERRRKRLAACPRKASAWSEMININSII
ncbi:MAG: hypothetical protein H0Z31_00520 [Bacillus sp. (in: Bacteria)]|nr:hypothetical protein [Bacillus sp. (in: firmicutes)]